jgi:hypothetical protein
MNDQELRALVEQYQEGLLRPYEGKPLPKNFGIILSALNKAHEEGRVEIEPATEVFVMPGEAPREDLTEHILAVVRSQLNDPMQSASGMAKNISDLEKLLAERVELDAKIAEAVSRVPGAKLPPAGAEPKPMREDPPVRETPDGFEWTRTPFGWVLRKAL